VYLSGYRPGAVGTLLRSDDGGMTLRATSARFPELASVWIAAVHPTIPDRLWLRVAAGLGTELHRSDDGGDTFAQVNTLRVLCLAVHNDALWACSDWLRGPFALGRSTDGGRTFTPVLQFRDIAGPVDCAAEGDDACEGRWPALLTSLQQAATRDAGVRLDDAAPVDARDASAPTGDVLRYRPQTQVGTCGCRAQGGAGGRAAAWLALALALRARRRGRSRARGRSSRR
jgi:hypothetical protein